MDVSSHVHLWWVSTHYVYPSCSHAVSVCCWVQSSLHTLRQPAPVLYTCRTCWPEMRRTGGGKRVVTFYKLCLCICDDEARGSRVFVLPGKVVLTLKLDTQVISSSPPAQSLFPSQALSNGMNFTERLQKKYLLSISCLTGGKRSGTLEEEGRAQVRQAFCLDDLMNSEWHIIMLGILHHVSLFSKQRRLVGIWCRPEVCAYVLGGRNYYRDLWLTEVCCGDQ